MGQDHPDAKLHPYATGLAARLVAKHQEEAPLNLYAGWFCPFVQRVWLVLEVKKLAYQYKERARARIWIDFVTSRIIPAFHRFLQYQPKTVGASDEGLQKVREEFISKLKEFTEAMSNEGPFFLGDKLSLVDLILAPWAVRLWVFDHFTHGLHIPTDGADKAVWSRWQIWLHAVKELPAVKQTTSDHEHYIPIYQRYADDTAQSELAKATREGKGVP